MADTCVLCGGLDYQALYPVDSAFDGATFYPVRCRGCDHVGLSPRLPLDKLLAYYDGLDTRADLEDKIRARFRPRQRWVSKCLPGRGRLLDVGCGRGQFPAAMRDEEGWQAEGIEAEAVKAASGAAEFEMTIHQAPFDTWQGGEPGSYQAITAWHVLEHFLDPLVALRNARRLLAEDGRLFLEVPNFRSLGRVVGGARWVHYDVPYHQHFFTPTTLRRALEACDLEVVSVSRAPLDSDWWSIKRTLQRRCERWPLRILRPLVSFLPVPKLLSWMAAAFGYTETLQVQARPRRR